MVMPHADRTLTTTTAIEGHIWLANEKVFQTVVLNRGSEIFDCAVDGYGESICDGWLYDTLQGLGRKGAT